MIAWLSSYISYENANQNYIFGLSTIPFGLCILGNGCNSFLCWDICTGNAFFVALARVYYRVSLDFMNQDLPLALTVCVLMKRIKIKPRICCVDIDMLCLNVSVFRNKLYAAVYCP